VSINHDFVSVDSGIELSDMFIENYIKWINVTHTRTHKKSTKDKENKRQTQKRS